MRICVSVCVCVSVYAYSSVCVCVCVHACVRACIRVQLSHMFYSFVYAIFIHLLPQSIELVPTSPDKPYSQGKPGTFILHLFYIRTYCSYVFIVAVHTKCIRMAHSCYL